MCVCLCVCVLVCVCLCVCREGEISVTCVGRRLCCWWAVIIVCSKTKKNKKNKQTNKKQNRHTYALLVKMHEIPDLDAAPPCAITNNKDVSEAGFSGGGGGGGGVKRMARYDQLTSHLLGPRRGKWVLLPFQLGGLISMGVAFTVVGGQDLAAFAAHVDPGGGGAHMGGLSAWHFYVLFAVPQLFLSLLPSFASLTIISLIGALMSTTYCCIAVVLSFMTKRANGVSYAPAAGRSTTEMVFDAFNAMASVFFAFGAGKWGLREIGGGAWGGG